MIVLVLVALVIAFGIGMAYFGVKYSDARSSVKDQRAQLEFSDRKLIAMRKAVERHQELSNQLKEIDEAVDSGELNRIYNSIVSVRVP